MCLMIMIFSSVDKASHLCYQYGRPLLKLSCILGCEYQFGLQKNKENSNSWSFFVVHIMYTDISKVYNGRPNSTPKFWNFNQWRLSELPFRFLIYTLRMLSEILFSVLLILLTTVITRSKAQVRISWVIRSISYHRNRRVRRVEYTTSVARVIGFCRSVLVTVCVLHLLVCSFSFGSTIGKPNLRKSTNSICQKCSTGISIVWLPYTGLCMASW